MTFFASLPDDCGVRDILTLNRPAGRALIAFHEAVLRQPSPLSPGERELIAAYVSGLNACQYCHGTHTVAAEAFGVPEGTVAAMLDDVDAAPVDDRLKPILRYVRKLTHEPAKMVRADADAVYEAGWDEQALHDAVTTACLFNFMNRLVEGHGLKGDPGLYAERGASLTDGGYLQLLKYLDE